MAGSSVFITLRVRLEQFSKDLDNAARKLAATGRKFETIGKNMSVAFTLPLVAGAYKATQAFAEEELALNKLSAAVEANGKDVNTVVPEYQKWASEIQKITTIGDETTISLLALAETMKSSAPKEAVKNAIALNKALGVDLQTAVKMSVMAQNGQYTMLQRYVPALRAAKTETEKAAAVQKLFASGWNIALNEVKTFSGSMQVMKNAVGDAMEKIGAKIAPILTKLAVKVTELAVKFNGLSDRAAKAILIIGGIVAAIGPLFFIIGKVINGFNSLLRVLPMLLSPIGLITIAVAALAVAAVTIIKNWDLVKIFFQKLWINIQNIFYKSIIAILETLGKLTKFIGIDFQKSIDSMNKKLSENGKELVALKKESKEIKEAKEAEKEASKANAAALLAESLIVDGQAENYSNLNDELEKTNKLKEIALKPGISAKEASKQPIHLGEEWIYSGYEGKTGVFDNLGKSLNDLTPKLSKFQKAYTNLANKIQIDSEVIYNALAGLATDGFVSLGEAIGSVISGEITSFKDFLNSILKVLYDFMKAFGAQLIAIGVGRVALNPGDPAGWAQIAAGTALIAAGTAAAGITAKRAEQRQNEMQGYGTGTGSMNYNLESRLQGRDLYLSNQRETNYRGRIR